MLISLLSNQEREAKYHQHVKEANLRRETNKTVVASNDDKHRCSAEAKTLAKEALAAILIQEKLQKKLEKMEKDKERRQKVSEINDL